jgi:hypothetical protein
MLENLTCGDFEACQDQPFRLVAGSDRELELELAVVQPLSTESAGAKGRRPFSLLFLGPPQPVLPQRIYRLDHPRLGALEIFLVPLGPENQKMRYEAIFT